MKATNPYFLGSIWSSEETDTAMCSVRVTNKALERRKQLMLLKEEGVSSLGVQAIGEREKHISNEAEVRRSTR